MPTGTPKSPSPASPTPDTFNAERFDNRHLPLDFLRDVVREPLAPSRREDLLMETLPPLPAAGEGADPLRVPRPARAGTRRGVLAGGVLVLVGMAALAWWSAPGAEVGEQERARVPVEPGAGEQRGDASMSVERGAAAPAGSGPAGSGPAGSGPAGSAPAGSAPREESQKGPGGERETLGPARAAAGAVGTGQQNASSVAERADAKGKGGRVKNTSPWSSGEPPEGAEPAPVREQGNPSPAPPKEPVVRDSPFSPQG